MQLIDQNPGIGEKTSPLGFFPILALASALGVLLISFSFYMSQFGNLALESFFLPGLLLIYVPCLVRLMSPAPLRLERICLLCLIGIDFFLVQFMISPTYNSSYDAMLHWMTSDTILRTGHLFGVNSLLPVGPYYPGLEIVTNALISISGLNIFQAGTLVIGVARLLMILSLYMFYEHLTKSSRVAGIAVMFYMTNPHFLFFDAIFSYETLALPIATYILYILVRHCHPAREPLVRDHYLRVLFIALLSLVALTITHHMTDDILDTFLAFWTIVGLFRFSGRRVAIPGTLAAVALSGILFAAEYAFLLPGNPVWEYLSTYFTTAFGELHRIVTGTATSRQLFTSHAGISAPLWDRLLMLGSVAFIMLGLPFGLLTLWKQHRQDVLAITLGLATLAYPLTQMFRLTNYGSDIADRAAAFIFVPIAYVLAIFITGLPPVQGRGRGIQGLIICAMAVMLLGGALVESGAAYSGLPGPYMVIADGRSVEPIGIQAAQWSLSHLGPDNRIATDRINQVVFGTFGEQRIVSEQEDYVNFAPIFLSPHLDQQTIQLLRKARIRYIVVDLRLSTSFPLLGFYFDPDEPGAFHRDSPISRENLTKFSTVPQINQIFDDGSIIIYDVSALTGE
jgi:hypothetical protein